MSGGQAHGLPGAGPSAGAEGRQPEIRAHEAHIVGQEALRPELAGVGPEGFVVGDSPHVHHGGGAGGNEVAPDANVADGEASPGEERAGRVDSERLLDDGLEVAEVGDVGGGDEARVADEAVDLGLSSGLDAWVKHHSRHDPFQENGYCVGSSKYHLLVFKQGDSLLVPNVMKTSKLLNLIKEKEIQS